MQTVITTKGAVNTYKELSDLAAEGFTPSAIMPEAFGGTKAGYTPPTGAPEEVVPNIPGRSHSSRDFGVEAEVDPDVSFQTALEDNRISFEKITEPVIQFVLYNPANEEVRQTHNGREYIFPPHSKTYYKGLGAGECPVFDGIEMVEDTKYGRRTFRPIPAIYIVRFMVGHDGRSGQVGGRGIRALFRDNTFVKVEGQPVLKDELVKQEARRVYLKSHYDNMRYVIAAHESRTKNERNQSVPITPPNDKVMSAYKFVAWYEMEHGGGNAPISRFPCAKCGWPHEYESERNAHIESMHKDYAAELGLLGRGTPASPEEHIQRIKEANQLQAKPVEATVTAPNVLDAPKKAPRGKKKAV